MASISGGPAPEEFPLENPIDSTKEKQPPKETPLKSIAQETLQQVPNEPKKLEESQETLFVDWNLGVAHSDLNLIIQNLRESTGITDEIRLLKDIIPNNLGVSTIENLHPLEEFTLKFYIDDGYKLINGIFDYDKSILDFMKGRKIPADQFEAVKKIGLFFAKILASALKHLPENESPIHLYRGSCLPKDRAEHIKVGDYIHRKPFSSYSSDRDIAVDFSDTNVKEAKKAGKKDSVPILYDTKTIRGKSLQQFVPHGDEEEESEYLFIPDTSFRVSKVDVEFKTEKQFINQGSEDYDKAKRSGTLKIHPHMGSYYIEVESAPTYVVHLEDDLPTQGKA